MAVDEKSPPQWKQVLDYFKRNEWVSYNELGYNLRINGPRARVSDLRKRGYEFDDRKVETENSYYKEFKLKNNNS